MTDFKLYTIGFTQKNAKSFFSLLERYKVRRIIDVRLNNRSQLAAFTKADDLSFFLQKILAAEYIHRPDLAPTSEILDSYKKKQITWEEYEWQFVSLLKQRNTVKDLSPEFLQDACLLCSEPEAKQCHRRLVAEHIKRIHPDLNIIHL